MQMYWHILHMRKHLQSMYIGLSILNMLKDSQCICVHTVSTVVCCDSFITVTNFLYLVCGLSYFPHGLLSCCSQSFIIFLQAMIPCLHCCTITTGQWMQFIINSHNLFAEVHNTSTDTNTPACHQPSVWFESKGVTATCMIEKTDPTVVVPNNPIMTITYVLRRHPAHEYQCSAWWGEGKFNLNTSMYTKPQVPGHQRSTPLNVPWTDKALTIWSIADNCEKPTVSNDDHM
jgi:hypothetical protein